MSDFAIEKSSHHSLSNHLRSYFILDDYTGTIHTSKLLDLENFCDLNICKNRLLKIEDEYQRKHESEATTGNNTAADIYKQNCLIEFKIKATRHLHSVDEKNLTITQPSLRTTATNTITGDDSFGLQTLSQQQQVPRESVYHITFDLILIDINEYRPEFFRKDPLYFNVSEEFAPIKLPIGSVAYDNDCNDRGRLFYEVKVVKINGRLLDDYLTEMKLFLLGSSSPYADYMRGNKTTNMFGFQVI